MTTSSGIEATIAVSLFASAILIIFSILLVELKYRIQQNQNNENESGKRWMDRFSLSV